MFKRFQRPVLLSLFLLAIPPFFYFFNYIPPTSPNMDNKTAYELPYPGLLPDHPLYLLKTFRDRTLVFVTQDYEKRAKIQLELSDKRIRAGELLMGEEKYELALTVFSKGERYFEQAIETSEAAQTQGQAPTAGMVEQMKRSNLKHSEILMRSSKKFDSSLRSEFDLVLTLNKKNKNKLQSLK